MVAAVFRFIRICAVTLFLVAAAGLGYIFYGLLWSIRFMQKRGALIVVPVVVLIAAIAFVGTFVMFPVFKGAPVEVTVKQGSTLRTVADALRAKEVIVSGKALIVWMRLLKTERNVQAGKYLFFEHEGVIAVADKLLHAHPEEMPVTIREGLTIEQTASRFFGELGVDSVAFVNLCYDSRFIATLGVGDPTSLEGYLFPNTYLIPPDASAKDIVRRMVARFGVEYARVVPDPKSVTDLNLNQIVTVASIVEKESAVPSERYRIAGVFLNRVKIKMPLGADPTVRYAVKKFSGPIRMSDLNSNSPYNTRRFAGLPPGPICSPGFGSLQATVAPLQTRELFFVAKGDGSGAHYFSRTNAEHNHWKAIAAETRNRRVDSLANHVGMVDSVALDGTEVLDSLP